MCQTKSPRKGFSYLNLTRAKTRSRPSLFPTLLYSICTYSPVMLTHRDLSKRAERPMQLLPTKQERIDAKKKKNTADTAGPAWFNMPAAEKTPELELDLRLLSMRSALDPKQHYRKGERLFAGKYFQAGTIISDPTGHYNDRLTRKQRGTTILETLLRDTERQKMLKKKYDKLQDASIKAGRTFHPARSKKKSWAGVKK